MIGDENMDETLEILKRYSSEGQKARETFFKENSISMIQAAAKTAEIFTNGGRLLICGNGGSAADAQHIAGELVNRFLIDRPALPAIALTTDTSVLTAISNDFTFDNIFSRQIEALGCETDILLAISTSGNSENIVRAIHTARRQHLYTIGLTAQPGGKIGTLCDLIIKTPALATPLVQELHLAFEHIYCQMIDYFLFENPEKRRILCN